MRMPLISASRLDQLLQQKKHKLYVENLLLRIFSLSYPQKSLLLVNLRSEGKDSFKFEQCHFSVHFYNFFKSLPKTGNSFDEIIYYAKILKTRAISIIDGQGQVNKIL